MEQIGKPYANVPIDQPPHSIQQIELSILLDNVRSALNVGSILRSAEGLGVKHIYLCGITPTADHPKINKTALGAESNISCSYHLNALDTVDGLKRSSLQIWSLEIAPRSIPIVEALHYPLPDHLLLVAGNELSGVDPEILSISDRIIFLPMTGKKTSLNIAVAVGVAVSLIRVPGWV
ncbi:MAG: hypothetical protein JW704_01810 [Anaerolineaceae bacterium]|nr:hypothetical protein [Anaerolineaceae bacterium]MBN2678190.1 hypothetical protein [Anaerolineaceae bacterium]